MVNKILVVDDNADICTLIRIALTNKGLDVRTAANGRDGVRVFCEFHPDVVLLDYILPDMNGNDVARTIKATGHVSYIITMTGEEVSPNDVDKSLYAGSLKKPFNLSDMVRYVESCMKK